MKLKCPWTRKTEKQVKHWDSKDSEEATTIETTDSYFGECVYNECPFFSPMFGHCERSDQK